MPKRICVLQDISPDFNFSEIFGIAGETISAGQAAQNYLFAHKHETDTEKVQITSIYVGQKAAKCKGCFGCWLKTPGECVMHDGSEHIGSVLMSSDQIYILSRSCYGGFSIEMKRILDRCIPGVLPFFRYVDRKMHHVPRFGNKPDYKIAFYEMGECTGQEKETAVKAAKAMSVNFNAKSCKVVLFDGEITAKEAVEL